MANERHQQNRPVGDEDLARGRDGAESNDANIVSGGVGPSGSGFNSTGRVGGLGNTSDGMHSRSQRSMGADDHGLEGMQIIDTNLTDSGINPYDSGDVNDEDGRNGE